ncbi:MAG: TOBE domain-containing protein, partial [Pseudomonadota bacterium]
EPASVMDGRVVEFDDRYGLAKVDVPGTTLLVAGDIGPLDAVRRLRITASDVSLSRAAATDTTILNAVPACIQSVEPSGETQMTVRLRLGEDGLGAPLISRVSRLSWDRLGFQVGETVIAQIKAVALAKS